MLLADALSRLSPEEKNPVKDMNMEIHEVCPQFSSEMIEKVKQKTTSEELMMLKKIVHEGWPTSKKFHKFSNRIGPTETKLLLTM